jgi:hypothetical protein
MSSFSNLPADGAAYLMEPEICNDNMRAIIVSDFHFGKVHPIGRTLPRLLVLLSTIIVDKRANVLFLLGDLLQHALAAGMSPPPKAEQVADCTAILKRLDGLALPIYWIPGSDERKLIPDLKPVLGGNVRSCPENFIRLKHPHPRRGTYPSIFVTYSGGYEFGVVEGQVKMFVTTLKTHFAPFIPADALLMVGCTAKNEPYENQKVVALDQFSIDNGKLSYALISAEGRFTIDYASLPMPDLS